MAYDSYKLTQNVSTSTPQNKMLYDKKKQVEYLYSLAMDRVDGCLLNNKDFTQSPRVFNRKPKTNYTETVTVETINIDDNFKSGDMLKFDNYNWLCVSSYIFHDLYCKGEFIRCNWILKWQKSDGTILSYPCIDESKSTSGGEDDNKIIISGDAQHLITLPYDENTILIRSPQRFILDNHPTTPTPFKVVQNNNTSYEGLVKIVVDQDKLNLVTSPIDRVDLGICNYISPTVSPPDKSGILLYSKITYTGNNELKIGGSNKTFTCTAFGLSDNVVSITPKWTVTSLPEFDKYIHYITSGNVIKIKVDDIVEMLNSKIKLEVQDDNGDYYSSIYLNIVAGV